MDDRCELNRVSWLIYTVTRLQLDTLYRRTGRSTRQKSQEGDVVCPQIGNFNHSYAAGTPSPG
jgi:hypothetical protein